jgi:uncharacterized membrane protein YidH (DUF202 family)
VANTPPHQSEQTGNAGLDRIQNNVRNLIAWVRTQLLRSIHAHGVGLTRIHMRDANYTATSADIAGAFIVIDGPLTAARSITVPRASDSGAYGRWVKNSTGQNLTFLNADGSTTLTAAAGQGRIVVSEDGPEVWA